MYAFAQLTNALAARPAVEKMVCIAMNAVATSTMTAQTSGLPIQRTVPNTHVVYLGVFKQPTSCLDSATIILVTGTGDAMRKDAGWHWLTLVRRMLGATSIHAMNLVVLRDASQTWDFIVWGILVLEISAGSELML